MTHQSLTGQSKRFLRNPKYAPYISIVVFVLLWQVVGPLLPADDLPTPASVGASIWDELRGETLSRYTVYESFGLTLLRMSAGLAIAGGLGIAIGIAMGQSRIFEGALHDGVLGLLMAPHLVFALLFAMWLGFGFWTPVATVVLATIPFVIINTAEGVRSVPVELVEMSKAFGVKQATIVRHVIVPSLTPYLFAAARYALSIGWKAIVLAEIWGADNGAGWVIKYWYDAHRISALTGYALMFVALVVGIDHLVFQPLNKRLLGWQDRSEDNAELMHEQVAAVEAASVGVE